MQWSIKDHFVIIKDVHNLTQTLLTGLTVLLIVGNKKLLLQTLRLQTLHKITSCCIKIFVKVPVKAITNNFFQRDFMNRSWQL